MSFPMRTSRLAAPRSAIAFQSRRTFRASAIRSLKESDRHNPDQAADNAKHQADSVSKAKDGKGHWKPELASDSEEAVAADRSDHSAESLKDLQDKTAGHAEKKHK
ncbi:hypothetical protein BJ878DRAFT_412221 [Calycina marina]|uniref:Uncharacterized protein n=1 Tax=Calycina marina TaxID=1763456 RepID=A0A9P7ZAN8_9HELO|nr:hypothetical protein BJ878DRAFT_412221 [Calycina marina]